MDVSKKKSLLKKLAMPGKASKDPMLSADSNEMDLNGPDASGAPGEADQESPMDDAQAGAGEESPAEEAKELHELPDALLVKEMKARGFQVTPPKGKKPEEGSPEEEASESPDQEQAEDQVPTDSGANKF